MGSSEARQFCVLGPDGAIDSLRRVVSKGVVEADFFIGVGHVHTVDGLEEFSDHVNVVEVHRDDGDDDGVGQQAFGSESIVSVCVPLLLARRPGTDGSPDDDKSDEKAGQDDPRYCKSHPCGGN